MKYALGIAGVRMAWDMILMGRRIVRFAERMEMHAAEPDTVLSSIAWRLMNLGERVEDFGNGVSGAGRHWARRNGCDMELVLARFI